MISFRTFVGRALLFAIYAVLYGPEPIYAEDAPQVDPDGTIHVPAFILPESSLLSAESRAELAKQREPALDAFAIAATACPSVSTANPDQLEAIRQCQARAFEATAFYRSMLTRYPVTVTPKTIGGVYTEIVIPRQRVAPTNRRRVLINLHGGSFFSGSRTNSKAESIPVASVGGIEVISVDYRLAPEYRFPAAVVDVVAVYREMLKRYPPRNIGLYGCSAGGALAAQTISWLLNHDLPLPGAVGLFCYGAGRALDATSERWVHSDSAYFAGALTGTYDQLLRPLTYYQGIDLQGPLINPGDHDEIMRLFPPTLLISGTRDYLLSSVVSTHSQLVRLGVAVDLHVWEGMQHAFIYYPELPESREAYRVINRFFDRYLGR
jgi:monoterpene epsilon-lactone hydrolase